MYGARVSLLTVTDRVAAPPSLLARHVTVTPLVSDEIVRGPHPSVLEIPDCGSVTTQFTTTVDTYQPPRPSVPVTAGSILGGVVSAGPATENERSTVVEFPAASVLVTLKVFTPGVEVSSPSPLLTVP
jgi:hypothetical protein